MREDTAIGLTFPFLFSIAVILMAQNAGNVHLDTDAVLLGELAFAPFNRLEVGGLDLGPQALVVMASMLVLNGALVATLYKELKLSAFDPELAAALGLAPGVVHLLLMASVSLTTLTAFDAVGSILVVGLMIGPPATAFLLVESLGAMLFLSGGLGVVAAIMGYWLANLLDASIGGSIASMCGLLFLMAVAGSPTRGVVAVWLRRRRPRRALGAALVVARLQRERRPVAMAALSDALGWDAQTLRPSRTPRLRRRLSWTATNCACLAQDLVRRHDLVFENRHGDACPMSQGLHLGVAVRGWLLVHDEPCSGQVDHQEHRYSVFRVDPRFLAEVEHQRAACGLDGEEHIHRRRMGLGVRLAAHFG